MSRNRKRSEPEGMPIEESTPEDATFATALGECLVFSNP